MHLLMIISLASAISPLVVSARGTLGFSIGARRPDHRCKTIADYEADFDALKSKAGSTIVRTYSVIDVNVPEYTCETAATILPAAKSKNFKVILGLGADTQEHYDSEKAALDPVLTSEYAPYVHALVTGSESLYRNISAQELLPRINDTKRDITDATETYLDDLQQAFSHIQDIVGLDTVEIWNGETGWPGDGGSNHGKAQASTLNEEKFFKTGVCAALAWGINVFYFEAFDESWKPKSTGDNGEQ
ncbi:MAG: hypothetical protein Q9193_006476, partial [Seirophora villosa]